ncbi:MAG: peroxidase family protein [Pseudomonadota bacterium]
MMIERFDVAAASLLCLICAPFISQSAHADPASSDVDFRFGSLFSELGEQEITDGTLLDVGLSSYDKDNPAYMEDSQFRGTDNNSRIPVGHTYVGQLLTHDMSQDKDTKLDRQFTPSAIKNHSTPWIDLDIIYNYAGQPAEKDPTDPAKLLLGNDIGNERDFARDAKGRALISDQRNDQNNNIAQLTAVVMQFHNAQVDRLRQEAGVDDSEALFDQARDLTIAHWQAIALTEFLPMFVEEDLIDDIIKNGPKVYTDDMANAGMVPVEFSAAAFRFGHSIVRGRYTLNDNEGSDRVRLFPLSPKELERSLIGHRAIPKERQIDWDRFFDFETSIQGDLDDDEDQFRGLQVSRKIDRFLARPMLRIPEFLMLGRPVPEHLLEEQLIPDRDVLSLASLNLQRGKALRLPSGQAVAAQMGEKPLSNEDMGLCVDMQSCSEWGYKWQDGSNDAPLFLYILEESRLQGGGEKLGAVGGRIVAEVMIGLMRADPTSIMNKNFVSPLTGTSNYTMADMIYHAGWHQARPGSLTQASSNENES